MNIGITDLTERKRLKILPSSTKTRTNPDNSRPGVVGLSTGLLKSRYKITNLEFSYSLYIMSQIILREKAVTVHFVLTITVLGGYLNNLTSFGRVHVAVKYELERAIF